VKPSLKPCAEKFVLMADLVALGGNVTQDGLIGATPPHAFADYVCCR
jgi:hypothetical protein